MGRLEGAHHIRRRREVGPVARLRSGHPQGDGRVRLAHPRRPEREAVAARLDEAQGGELSDLPAVEGGLAVEVGEAQPASQPPGSGLGHLQLAEALKHLGRREPVA